MVARVKRGARLLDQHRPGWAGQIDLRRLGGLENDVLTQLYGDHSVAMEALGFGSFAEHLDALYSDVPATTYREGSVPDYGFAAYPEDADGIWRRAYQELRRLWRAEIKSRLTR
jgi:hypothetical protein